MTSTMLSVFFLALTASAAPTDIYLRATTCSGNPSLAQCGGAFPSDFCCPYSSICLPLNATGVIATVCCPPGVDCTIIQPTTCETQAYNASSAAANQVHASPILPLATCGQACCPAGYRCRDNSTCVAITSSASTTLPTQSIASTASATPTAAAASDVVSPVPTSSSFNGGSFAAGFVPGIIIGMLILALIFWLLKHRRVASYDNDKSLSQDQLTYLGPATGARLQPHMRSISEPVVTNGSHRSDFLRSSPQHDSAHDSDHTGNFDAIEEESSGSDSNRYEPRPMFQFSPSPVPTQSPIPAHLKRGTLSYAISPIRQLRTKKSLQSLRRHAASPLRSASQRQRSSLARSNTTVSTETIQVLMTPDQRPDYLDPATARDRSRTPVASSIYPDHSAWSTPSRQPANSQPGMLGSPYSYQPRDGSSNHLTASEQTRHKRVTTFSSLMERAGLRKEDILPGPLR